MCFGVQEFSWVGHALITFAGGSVLMGVLAGWGAWRVLGFVGFMAFYLVREWLDRRKHKAKGDYRQAQGAGEATSRGDGVGDFVGPAAVGLTAVVVALPWWAGAPAGVLLAAGVAVWVWRSARAKDWRRSHA